MYAASVTWGQAGDYALLNIWLFCRSERPQDVPYETHSYAKNVEL